MRTSSPVIFNLAARSTGAAAFLGSAPLAGAVSQNLQASIIPP